MPGLSTRAQLMVVGRIGLAGACFAAPDLVVKVLGFPERSSTARVLARMVGVRDLGVALMLVATASDPAAQRRAMQVAGVVDVGDVLCVALGAARDPVLRGAAARNLPFAGGSAVFSFLAARSA